MLRQRAAARDVSRFVRPSGRRISSHPFIFIFIYIYIYTIYINYKLSTAYRTKEALRQRAVAREVSRFVRLTNGFFYIMVGFFAYRTNARSKQDTSARDVRRFVRPSGRRIASHPLKACARRARSVRAVRGPAHTTPVVHCYLKLTEVPLLL